MVDIGPLFLQNCIQKKLLEKGSMEMSKSIYKHFSTTLKILKETYSVFRNSELHLAGSMGEQTKVGRPDEFDFVIILPQLSKIDIFWPDRMRKNTHIRDLAKNFNFFWIPGRIY